VTKLRLTRGDLPKEALEVARKRVQAHIHNLAMVDFDLEQLAVNCYAQGARDMVETVISRPWCLYAETLPDDYQI